MSVKVASNRFIVSSVTGFYQHLTCRISDFQGLGDYLVREAELAQSFRRANRIEELGIVLSNIPIKEYKLIGQYYTGWASYLRGERPRKVFERVAEQSQQYKAKGLISLAVVEAHRGDYTSELAYYNEALKCADNPSTKVDILRAIATVKAKEGFNKQSLRDLEQMWPLVRHGDLRVYHNYLNSLAVELGEAGRIEEAQNVCRITLASPFVFAYPEWRETEQDLALRGYKSRSSLRVKLPGNLLYMPEPVASEASDTCIQSELSESAPVVSLEEWKEQKMVKEPNGDDEKLPEKVPDGMSVREMAMMLLEVITQNKDEETKLRQVLNYALEVFSKSSKK